MGLNGEHVLPRIVNVARTVKAATAQRRRVCAGLGQSLPFPDDSFDAHSRGVAHAA
jgi:hypothetical protein